MMCWDAALYCAWAAKGIECADITVNGPLGLGVVTNSGYDRMFPNPVTVVDANGIAAIPAGAFIGFLGGTPPNTLRHAIVAIGNGRAAGTKNDCIFRAGSNVGWESLDLAPFFAADSAVNGNATTRMIYQPVAGQAV